MTDRDKAVQAFFKKVITTNNGGTSMGSATTITPPISGNMSATAVELQQSLVRFMEAYNTKDETAIEKLVKSLRVI